MNKRIILTIISILVLLIGFIGVKTITNKNSQRGNKTITIEIISKADNLNEKEEINTDEVKLGPVLLNKGFKIENGMVLKINNIDLTNSDSEFWYITVNGEDAKVGVNDLLIKNGDIIKFERIKFK